MLMLIERKTGEIMSRRWFSILKQLKSTLNRNVEKEGREYVGGGDGRKGKLLCFEGAENFRG